MFSVSLGCCFQISCSSTNQGHQWFLKELQAILAWFSNLCLRVSRGRALVTVLTAHLLLLDIHIKCGEFLLYIYITINLCMTIAFVHQCSVDWLQCRLGRGK